MKRDNNEQWGNIELPGLSDDILLSPNLNRILANRAKAKDPNWQNKVKSAIKKRSKDLNWRKNVALANQQKAQDEEYENNRIAAAIAALQTDETKIKQKNGCKERSKTKWRVNVAKGAKKREEANTFNRLELNRKTMATKKYKDAHKKGIANRSKNPDNFKTCEVCGKHMVMANYIRWGHGPNCTKG